MDYFRARRLLPAIDGWRTKAGHYSVFNCHPLALRTVMNAHSQRTYLWPRGDNLPGRLSKDSLSASGGVEETVVHYYVEATAVKRCARLH